MCPHRNGVDIRNGRESYSETQQHGDSQQPSKDSRSQQFYCGTRLETEDSLVVIYSTSTLWYTCPPTLLVLNWHRHFATIKYYSPWLWTQYTVSRLPSTSVGLLNHHNCRGREAMLSISHAGHAPFHCLFGKIFVFFLGNDEMAGNWTLLQLDQTHRTTDEDFYSKITSSSLLFMWYFQL